MELRGKKILKNYRHNLSVERGEIDSFSGFINGQGVPPYTQLILGDYGNGYNICGGISLYNFARLKGVKIPISRALYRLDRLALTPLPFFKRGIIGCHIWGISKVLNSLNIPNNVIFSQKKGDNNLRNNSPIILLFADKNTFRMHYITINPVGNNAIEVYNLYNNSTKSYLANYNSLAEFLHKIKGIFICGIV